MAGKKSTRKAKASHGTERRRGGRSNQPNAPGLTKLLTGGAISQLCQYFHSLGGRPHHWRAVREYAYREFREVPSVTIDRVVEQCQKACSAGRIQDGLEGDECLRMADIPKLPR